LIAAVQVALQSKQLKIASGLQDAQILRDELAAYQVTVSEDGRDSYGNGREAPNDDLVLALAIAAYVATKRITRSRITHVGLEPSPTPATPFRPDYIISSELFRH
jgi:hypothetical protein